MWGDVGPDDTEAALSVALARLRSALDPVGIEDRGAVRLMLGSAWVDIEAAADAIHRAESAVMRREWSTAWTAAQAAMFTATRDFLPGEEAGWIDEVRRQLDSTHTRAVESLAVVLAAEGRRPDP